MGSRNRTPQSAKGRSPGSGRDYRRDSDGSKPRKRYDRTDRRQNGSVGRTARLRASHDGMDNEY